MASNTIFFLFWRKAFSPSHSSILYRKSEDAVLFKGEKIKTITHVFLKLKKIAKLVDF